MATPLVSVVIPCYRQAHFLHECIASLQAQTLSEWEAIIVDDGSPDDTAAIAAKLASKDTRVRLVRKPNGGLSSARNAGIALARGRYMQFLDADDLLEPAKLGWQSAFLASTSDIDAVFGNAWFFPDNEPTTRVRRAFGARNPLHDWISEWAADPRPLLEKLLSRNQFPVCSPLVTRSAVDRAGLFLERLGALEDWEYWTRCANAGMLFSYQNIPGTEPLIRVHGASMTQDAARMNGAVFDMRMATLEYIQTPALRRIVLPRLVEAINQLPASRNSRFRELASRVRVGDEATAVWIARRFGRGTRLHRIARPLLRMLPWRLGAPALS